MIFGTYADDALALAAWRAEHRGLQHGRRLTPAIPRPDTPTTVHLSVGAALTLDDLRLFYTTDGREPDEQAPTVPFVRRAVVWESLLWGYRELWEATLPPFPAGTFVRYRIRGIDEEGTPIWADHPPPDAVLLEQTFRRFGSPHVEGPLPLPPRPPVFAFVVRDGYRPPAWASEAVLYHIFVDRFHPGPGQTFRPCERPHQRCGGTLQGILHRLEALAAMGIDTLWLSPIFPSPTAHGYDATDYFDVEPSLGTMEDFHALADALHARGMHLILDLALNHISDRHPLFLEARSSPHNRYRDWFVFDERYPPGYRAYYHLPTMPEWNIDNPQVRRYLCDVGRFWLKQGADGFRLDYADGPGATFWLEFVEAGRAVKPEAWFFGEIVQPPPRIAPYRGVLDGALDFVWAEQVRETLARGRRSLPSLVRFLERHRAAMHDDFLQPVFLDNHDMDRFLFAAGDDLRRVKLALLLLYAWPQPPILFYGTEAALTQEVSVEEVGLHASRVLLGDRPAVLQPWIRRLIAMRRAHPALIHGEERTTHIDETTWLAERHASTGERYLLAFHAADGPRRMALPARYHGCRPILTLEAAIEGATLHLEAWGGGLWAC